MPSLAIVPTPVDFDVSGDQPVAPAPAPSISALEDKIDALVKLGESRIRAVETETHRLNDQQHNLLAANTAVLQGFGTSIGHLAERVERGAYISAANFVASVVTAIMVVFIAAKVFG